jgi:hypothetical protein
MNRVARAHGLRAATKPYRACGLLERRTEESISPVESEELEEHLRLEHPIMFLYFIPGAIYGDHFRLEDGEIVRLPETAAATIRLLRLNLPGG